MKDTDMMLKGIKEKEKEIEIGREKERKGVRIGDRERKEKKE